METKMFFPVKLKKSTDSTSLNETEPTSVHAVHFFQIQKRLFPFNEGNQIKKISWKYITIETENLTHRDDLANEILYWKNNLSEGKVLHIN